MDTILMATLFVFVMMLSLTAIIGMGAAILLLIKYLREEIKEEGDE